MLAKKQLKYVKYCFWVAFQMSAKHLLKAVEIAAGGNQTKFSKLLSVHTGDNVSQQTVNHWIKSNRGCSSRYAIPIQEITGGKVKKEDLYPNFHWGKKDTAA